MSCIDNIMYLISHIKLGNNNKNITGTVFLDIAGAFDHVISHILLNILNFGLPANIIKFIDSIVSHRKLEGYISGNFLQTRHAYMGLPQGSVLSPLLFNLYLSHVHTSLPPNIKIVMYADDLPIFCSHPSIETIATQLNSTLININNHLKSIGLHLSPDKSKLCFFSSMSKTNLQRIITEKQIQIFLDNKPLEISWHQKFLGVHLTHDLDWKQHTAEIKKSSTSHKYFKSSDWNTMGGTPQNIQGCISWIYSFHIRLGRSNYFST